MPEGVPLVYADAGAHVNVEGRKRLLEYIEMIQNHPLPILGFELTHKEKNYTKGDLFQHLNYLKEEEINSLQLMATVIILINTPQVRNLIQKWNDICENNYHLIDDSPSIHLQNPDFWNHRHDQSVFSILRKQNNAKIIPDETWFPDTWHLNKQYPFHARRDRN